MAGERGHALQQFVMTPQGLACLLQLAVVEHQAQARQVHLQGGERLVDFVGQGCGHLSEGGQLGGLDQSVLGGAQGGGALLDQ
ncbi:hypothetical protein D9M68_207570 [compost metagenome]